MPLMANKTVAQKTVRCLVEGRVQGVFFRAATAAEAKRLNLSGFARNLSDGRVEVLVCGACDSVAELCRWLWQGSPASRVTAVSVQDCPQQRVEPGFKTR